MAFSELYNLETIGYGTTGWNGIAQSNFEKLEDNIHTVKKMELGETVTTYQAVYVKSDGKIWLAQADGAKQPCVGLMIEGGDALEQKRFQALGTITNAGWAFASIGQPVYLDDTTPGDLTQTKPSSNSQIIGYAVSATSLFLVPLSEITVAITNPYIIAFNRDGTLSDGQIFLTHKFPLSVTFPVNLAGSYISAYTAATAETIISIKKNGVEIGTATFAAAGTTATLVMASEQTFADGDVLTLVGPASADTTLADFYGTLEGVR